MPETTTPKESANSVSIDVRLLAILVTVLLACFGYISTVVTHIGELHRSVETLTTWKESHIREHSRNDAEVNERFKDLNTAFKLQWDEQKDFNKEQSETLTNIRIVVGAPAPRRTP